LLAASVQTLEPTQATESTPAPIVLENGWYVYNDPDGEFSFAYPPTATISAGQNPVDLSKNITLQFQVPDKTYQGMSIRVEPNPKGLQGAEIANQLYERSALQPATAAFMDSHQQIQVGGIAGVQTTIPSSNTEVTVIVPYGAKVLIAAPVHETSATQVEGDFRSVLSNHRHLKFNVAVNLQVGTSSMLTKILTFALLLVFFAGTACRFFRYRNCRPEQTIPSPGV
jgi:hypothetical protein